MDMIDEEEKAAVGGVQEYPRTNSSSRHSAHGLARMIIIDSLSILLLRELLMVVVVIMKLW